MVGKCQSAFDVIRDRFAGGVRQIIQRQDDDMIADTYAVIFTTVAKKS